MSPPEASDERVVPSQGAGHWRDHISFWFAIIGAVGTIIGLALTVYFYQLSNIKPQLTFAVHPLKTELRRPDFDKELGFIYAGKPIESESITSVQVAIWNAGNRSIRDSDVLEPIRLVMPEGSAILTVRVKKTTRQICGFDCVDDREDYKSGICRLKWRILEPSDGAVLQIIYAGNASHNPRLEGTVEGQRNGVVVERFDLALDRESAAPSIITLPLLLWILVPLFAVCLLLVVAGKVSAKTEAARHLAKERAVAEKRLAELRKKTVPQPPLFWVVIYAAIACLLIIPVAVAVTLFSTRNGPPFGW
jgi:hypothetical protein